MSRRFLMGLDAGGGGGRCLLVDVDGGECFSAFRRWSHPAAPDTGGLGHDLDCDGIGARLCDAVAEAMARADAGPDDVAGIAATSMRFAMVVIDAAGEPIYAGPNRDARAAGEGLRLAAEHGASLHALSGHWPVPIMPAARLQWLREREPEAWSRAHRFLALSDWIAFQLCGEAASEPSHAAGSLLFDLTRSEWSEEWITRLGLERAHFPPLRPSGSRLGELTGRAAEALGLRAGIPVAVGGGDTQCGLVGSGVLAPGALGIVAGTSAPVQQVTAEPTFDPDAALWTGAHLPPGRFVIESNAGSVGESIDWLAHLLFPSSPQPTARLLAEAAAAEAGARGMLSSLGVQVFDGRNMSVPMGGLSLSHLAAATDDGARGHVVRAVVEGHVMGLRANVEQAARVAGDEPDSLHLGGGLARSGFFCGLVADALGRTVLPAGHPEATALGAAVCAGVGAGLFADLDEASRALAPVASPVDPDPERAELYGNLYTRWSEVRRAAQPADDRVRAHAMPFVIGSGADAQATPALRARPRILATAELDESALHTLRSLGEVEYAPFMKAMRLLSGDALVRALEGVQVFITEIDVVDADVLARRPELRVVASCRGDAVNVDVEAASLLGVPVLNAPGRNADAVADLTIAFLLMLARKLQAASGFLREPGGEAGDMGRMGKAFGQLRGRELWSKTIGLVGFGAVGRGVARRLSGFGARILVHDPFVGADAAARADVEWVPLEELLASSDFVSLHAPVTDATRGLIDADAIARMKPGACLVNTARAALVDEDALLDALESGRLAGAALDVFPVEPPGSDDPLFTFDNVIGTPHVGGNTVDIAAHQGAIIGADIERLLRGQRPLYALNPEVLDDFDWDRPRPEADHEALARLAAKPGPAVSDLQKERKPARRAPAGDPPGASVPEPAPAPSPAAAGGTAEALRAILERFVERIPSSGALDRFAADRDVTLHFTLTDLGDAFWFRLRDGVVTSGHGGPDAEAEVQLKLAADVFDGMFTGRANPMQAAMDGRLSFAGDTAKAMSLQEFQGDLSRLYREARDALGDPGDLTSLGAGSAAGGSAPAGEGDVRHELVQVVGELYAQQLITATGGNVSMRIPGHDELWITPSQLFKGDLAPEVLVRIDSAGKALDGGTRAASSERLMHCAVYTSRPEANAVIHAHAPHATILANAGLPFLPISTEAAFFDDLPRVPFIMPGTQELADAVGAALRESWAVLLQNHGLLVAGRSLRRAADMAEIIERSCEIILGCRAQGVEPPVLPDDVVATLRKMGDLVA